MKKKKSLEFMVDPKDKKKTMLQFFQYFELSGLLFDNTKAEIYNVTDIPAKNKFYKMAQEKAKELGVDWKQMSHEDSNRIMLAMLEDSYNLIRDIENSKNIVLTTTLQILKADE